MKKTERFLGLASNLRALFGFLRVATLAVGVLRLVMFVAYPIFGLHIPVVQHPLAEVAVRPVEGHYRAALLGAPPEALELSGTRGMLSFRPEFATPEMDSLIRWQFLLSEAVWYAFYCVLFDLLWRFCKNVERGAIFAHENVTLARRVGIAILAYQVIAYSGGLLYNAKVEEFLQQYVTVEGFTLHSRAMFFFALNTKLIGTGLLVLLLSEVFRQGLELKTESELVV